MSSTVSKDERAKTRSRARIEGSKMRSVIQQNSVEKVDAVLCFLQRRVIEMLCEQKSRVICMGLGPLSA